MKTKFIVALFLLTSIFVGCKDEKSVDNLEVVENKVEDNSFKVILDVEVKAKDDFSLFYTEDGTIDFSKIAPIWQGVKGNGASELITYVLPEGVIPTQIRLDFGMNKSQEDIKINSITLSYKGKTKKIGSPEFVSYFRADETKCEFDPVTGIIKAKVVDGVRLYPSLYPHEVAIEKEISKLAK
jgi:hypothetical protein